jgi:FkbM family methyltransferase
VRVDPESSRVAGRNLAELLARADGLGALHRMLGDERSRETLIAVLAFRVLGYRHVRLPPDEPDYWARARVARSRDATAAGVSTRCMDDLVAERGLDRVDFIKLDIEGAGLQALRGAERALRRFRPAIAVCLYHRLDDFVTIPAYLRELALGYEFHLDHFWVHEAETVLFARPAAR